MSCVVAGQIKCGFSVELARTPSLVKIFVDYKGLSTKD